MARTGHEFGYKTAHRADVGNVKPWGAGFPSVEAQHRRQSE